MCSGLPMFVRYACDLPLLFTEANSFDAHLSDKGGVTGVKTAALGFILSICCS